MLSFTRQRQKMYTIFKRCHTERNGVVSTPFYSLCCNHHGIASEKLEVCSQKLAERLVHSNLLPVWWLDRVVFIANVVFGDETCIWWMNIKKEVKILEGKNYFCRLLMFLTSHVGDFDATSVAKTSGRIEVVSFSRPKESSSRSTETTIQILFYSDTTSQNMML